MTEDERAIRSLVDTWKAASRTGNAATVLRRGYTLTILRKQGGAGVCIGTPTC